MSSRHYTIDELKALVAAEQGSRSIQARPQTRHVPYQPPPLKRDIQRAIYNVVYNAGGAAISRRQIADAIGIKKTTWLEQHIERLVEDCHLVKTSKPYRPGMMMYFYEVQR